MKCQFESCKADAAVEPVGHGRIGAGEVDVYLCDSHREALLRGVAAHLAPVVKATPAGAANSQPRPEGRA